MSDLGNKLFIETLDRMDLVCAGQGYRPMFDVVQSLRETLDALTIATQRAEELNAGWQRTYDHDCAKLLERAEAAEAERDEVMRCCRGTRMDDAALVSIREYVAEKLRIEAERDALRKHLLDLLAVVHGDGGHHTDAVGVRQSVVEAELAFHALRKDAARLDWLEKAANCAIEVESFIGADNEKNAVFLEWAWDDIPPDFVRSVPKRISQGRSLRAALDAALAVQP